ncbi:hypothetical protein Rm378p119 [Rhodothermus phage RM378]|uniref:hypothetical protein n=1 Tax=Rhodothermus phage RM378 TaxID=148943 RepID=UPI000018F677|nr:hypothetical protein Rm378p119 [Rhodothermus phage RM378]
MRAKDFYKTDIKVFTEVVGFPSPGSYENDNIKLEIAPDDQLKAQIRALFIDLFRKLNIDFDALTFEIVRIKRQYYHIHSITYGGNPISLVNDSYYDHPDFILVRNESFVVVGKKVPAISPLFFTLTLYELQPLKLLVAEFVAKNFTTNPTAVPGVSPYVSGIYGMNQNGDVVFVSKFSQPIKLDEAYVFVQKILIPSYSYVPPPPPSPSEPPPITTSDVNIELYFPNITTTDPNISLYFPDITTPSDIIVSLGFFYDQSPALFLNLHDGSSGEVGLLDSSGSYKQVTTTSIQYGGVAAWGYDVFWLDYYTTSSTETVSIKRLFLGGGYIEDYITFSNQGSTTFNALLYDITKSVFIVSADNGTYMVRKSPYLVTFSDFFGTASIFMDLNYSTSVLYYTDNTPYLKYASYTTTSPYFFNPINSGFLTVSYLSYFSVYVSTSTQYFYLTSSGANVVLKSTGNNLTFYSSPQMGALEVDWENVWNEPVNLLFFSAVTGSAWGLFKSPKSSVSVSFIGAVSKFVRQIAPVVNYVPVSNVYLTNSNSSMKNSFQSLGLTPSAALNTQLVSSEIPYDTYSQVPPFSNAGFKWELKAANYPFDTYSQVPPFSNAGFKWELKAANYPFDTYSQVPPFSNAGFKWELKAANKSYPTTTPEVDLDYLRFKF